MVEAAKLTHQLGMRVHAGHGLDYEHARKIKTLPYLQEVNIGHFLVCDALNAGLSVSVRKMKNILQGKKT